MSRPGVSEDDVGVELGAVLLGKYRIEAVLGRGGMGVVARATHLHLGEQVAIKFLRRDAASDAEAAQRFLREAQAAVRLKSEHVARVIDVGTLDGQVPYMVMEYLEGVDLDQMLEQSGTLGPGLAVDFVVQACAALAEAHAQGIVHRDIKPSNVFVTWRSDGSALIKVLDFGISKVVAGVSEMSLTRTQSVLGTPAYMSPEQMRSARAVDARTDIWSLGTVLYELVQGHRPFEAETFSEMCVKVAVDPPSPLTQPLPPGLAEVILRCLSKDPAGRYATVGELATALVPFANDPRRAELVAASIVRTLGRPHPRAATPAPLPARPGGGAFATERTPPPPMPAEPSEPSGLLRTDEGAVPTTAVPDTWAGAGSGVVAAPEPVTAAGGRRRPWLIGLVAALTVGAALAAIKLSGGGRDPDGQAGAVPALDAGAAGPDVGAASLDAGAAAVDPLDPGTATAGTATGATAGAATGETAGATAGATAGESTGTATGATTGATAGKATGAITGESTGTATGATAGKATGANAGKATGATAGKATGATAGKATGKAGGKATGKRGDRKPTGGDDDVFGSRK
ncbi:MAG: serine/threonine protein kinase [Myxococcales bacterium]|nr:serine/threonine protein kinase [Myxococcales bacterium]